jgi:hypothetical protein
VGGSDRSRKNDQAGMKVCAELSVQLLQKRT